ncbi:MAG: alanyl-tRNA editing protein [Candidatus Lokiarchaeota archaeon]
MTEKLYWKFPYKTEFIAKITEIDRKKGIVFDKTLFYPQGGGQESDKGYFEIQQKTIPVKNVTIDGQKIFHQIDSKNIQNLTVNQEIKGKIDWEYRYGLMKAHTAQHLVSALFENTYSIETERAYIESNRVILKLSETISYKQLKHVLKDTNVISIMRDLKVIEEILTREEVLKKYKSLRGKIPDQKPIRIVKIEDLDIICCGGTHVKELNEIGPIFIDEFKGKNEIKFKIGNDSIYDIIRSNIELLEIANELNMKITDFKKKFSSISNNLGNLEKENEDLKLWIINETLKNPNYILNHIKVFLLDLSVNYDTLIKKLDEIPENSLFIVFNSNNRIRIISKVEKVSANQIVSRIKEFFNGKGGGNEFNAQIYIEENFEKVKSEIKNLIKDLISTI